VIIVICDPDTREAYWERFEAEKVQVTDAGWILTIPYTNKLSSSKAALQSLVPGVVDVLADLQKYWRFNNLLADFAVIVLLADRAEVNARNIAWITSFFNRLRATKELAYDCQGKIEIGFYGYDDDKRELFEVDEVREYVRLLDQALPDLFFFARSDEHSVTLRLFLFCLMDVGWDGERSTPGNPQKVMVDLEHLPEFLEHHFQGLNMITDWLGLTDEENERIGRAAIKALGCIPEDVR
jgi:hypothetical protein